MELFVVSQSYYLYGILKQQTEIWNHLKSWGRGEDEITEYEGWSNEESSEGWKGEERNAGEA